MIEDIFILGATGNVGKTLVSQVYKKGDTDFNVHVNPTRIIGLASSTNFLYSNTGLSEEESKKFCQKDGDYKNYKSLEEILGVVRNTFQGSSSNLVFVDVTASKDEMLNFHKEVVGRTNYGLVTANKNPLAFSDFETFEKLTEDVERYGYRSAVMAGAEAVSMLQDLKDVSDFPTSIRGCFSGTLGYINSELDNGKKLSEVVKAAKLQGYTEPHPRDDLNGLDVARKLLILTRTAGYNVEMGDMNIEPFIPNKYLETEDIDSFLDNLSGLDNEYETKVKNAKMNNNVLRYVARMDIKEGKPIMDVGLKEVPYDGPLGSLRGTSNKIVIETGAYPNESPYSVEAPGAGLEVTAQNVRRNLLYHLQGRKYLR